MILNKVKLLYPYCACHTIKEMHSRDATFLIDLMSSTTPACFSTVFDLATIIPTLLKIPNFL